MFEHEPGILGQFGFELAGRPRGVAGEDPYLVESSDVAGLLLQVDGPEAADDLAKGEMDRRVTEMTGTS